MDYSFVLTQYYSAIGSTTLTNVTKNKMRKISDRQLAILEWEALGNKIRKNPDLIIKRHICKYVLEVKREFDRLWITQNILNSKI